MNFHISFWRCVLWWSIQPHGAVQVIFNYITELCIRLWQSMEKQNCKLRKWFERKDIYSATGSAEWVRLDAYFLKFPEAFVVLFWGGKKRKDRGLRRQRQMFWCSLNFKALKIQKQQEQLAFYPFPGSLLTQMRRFWDELRDTYT